MIVCWAASAAVKPRPGIKTVSELVLRSRSVWTLGRNDRNYTDSEAEKENVENKRAPLLDCHHIAEDWISRKSWLLMFFHSAIIPSARSDSDKAAFD